MNSIHWFFPTSPMPFVRAWYGSVNTVAEWFFGSLKKGHIRKRIYKNRNIAQRISSTTFTCRNTGSRVVVTSASSVQRTLNKPRREIRVCLLSCGQFSSKRTTTTEPKISGGIFFRSTSLINSLLHVIFVSSQMIIYSIVTMLYSYGIISWSWQFITNIIEVA